MRSGPAERYDADQDDSVLLEKIPVIEKGLLMTIHIPLADLSTKEGERDSHPSASAFGVGRGWKNPRYAAGGPQAEFFQKNGA